MAPRGTLVPPWYTNEVLESNILHACSIIWGFSLCSAMFSATKAARQSYSAYKKGKLFTAYPIMIWSEWTASVTISIISWLFLKGSIPASFWIYFFILVFWVVQMQCILQIIINRVALVMVNKSLARRLRLSVFFIVLMINISVFIIWMPARLQISETYIHINDIWDRTEKAIFAVVDAGLNVYFLRTVILIGSMSIGTGVIYIQFHPLVYLLKLHIELNMADLIAKVVRASNPMNNALDITDNTISSGGSGAKKKDPPISAPPSTYTHRDSGFQLESSIHRDSGCVSTIMSKEADLAEQGRRISGADYHKVLRPNLQLTRTGETILDDVDGETSSENEPREGKKSTAIQGQEKNYDHYFLHVE
ncbi:hypothetical protein PFICI_00546 [Pestalotiopsis fici W106-1]|uniref:Uncharacterized protein n=1 Tax=Pestalotiopsis fici (strain W106-1 / CGMCC3.15140) TaxID=1229662 RepID=W3XKZ6_PESFW|nr:uncharacterized protein PFICI_00546 [Pestalotiopsis fici W106-1]ETS86718.1 hypothetical protein PFICI_00546 [Pestalotiopsis fici W106-1]